MTNDSCYVANTSSKSRLWLSPVPEWTSAKHCLGDAWLFHIYLFAGSFLLLAVVASLQLAVFGRGKGGFTGRHLWRRQRSARRSASGVLPPPVLTLVALLGISRCLSLFVDPYSSTGQLSRLLGRALFGLGFTCLLGAYQLLFTALHTALRVEVGSFGWLRKKWLTAVLVVFFLLFNTLVDILLVGAVASRELLLICMFANMAWSITMVAEFSAIAYRLNVRMKFTRQMTRRNLEASGQAGAPTQGEKHSSGPGNKSVRSSCYSDSTVQSSETTRLTKMPWNFRLSVRSISMSSLAFISPRHHSGTSAAKKERARPGKAQQGIVHFALLAVVLSTIHLSFQIYFILCTLNIASFEQLVQPWTWYSIATAIRLVELVQASSILATLMAAQRRIRSQSHRRTLHRSHSSQVDAKAPPPLHATLTGSSASATFKVVSDDSRLQLICILAETSF